MSRQRRGHNVTTVAVIAGAGSSFTPHSDDFTTPGSSTVPVPVGAVQLDLEVWGGGGHGGHGASGGLDHQGGGGSSGGYVRHIIALSADGGKTLTYTVGAIASASSASAVLTNGSPSLSAGGGSSGLDATGSLNGGGQATGGTASGGNTSNVTGNAGTGGNTTGTAGQGGAANNGYGAAGQGGYTVSDTGHDAGIQNGRVKATWT